MFPCHPENDLGWRKQSERIPASKKLPIFLDVTDQDNQEYYLVSGGGGGDGGGAAELKEEKACFAAFIKYMDDLSRWIKRTIKKNTE